MNKFIAILSLAVIPLLSPTTGQAKSSAFHRSHFKIEKLSKREEGNRAYVDGEITSNARKKAKLVMILVRWYDKNDKVVDQYKSTVLTLDRARLTRFPPTPAKTQISFATMPA